MARITSPDAGLMRRAPRSRGRVVFATTGRGTLYARSWPRKRGKAKSQAQQYWQDWFAQQNKMMGRIDPEQYLAMLSASQGTPFMPRDFFLLMSAGKTAVIYNGDKRIKVPMATLIELSQLLDLITNQPGAYLRRGEDYWEGVMAGPDEGGYAYSDAATFEPDASSNNWAGYTLRCAIDDTALEGDGTKVRVTITADTDEGCEIDSAFVGIKATSGNDWDFASTPVQLTFDGSNSYTIPAGEYVVSDAVDLTVGDLDGIVLSLFVAGGASADDLSAKVSQTGWTCYERSGDYASDVAPSGFSSTTRDATAFTQIEYGTLVS